MCAHTTRPAIEPVNILFQQNLEVIILVANCLESVAASACFMAQKQHNYHMLMIMTAI